MNDNLAIWNAVEATDPAFTKQFSKGGGFKGTATNATYLIKKATNQFGPIGIGWGWTILEEKIVEGAASGTHVDKLHYLKLKLWYIWNGQRGEIEHFGQTMLVGKNKNGPFTDEEAPKKSLTDALSKAMSTLGFAADIHLGMYDDNRYVNDLKDDFRHGDEFSRSANDNRASNGNADDRDNGKNDDTIVDGLKRDISGCKTVADVVKLMNDKGVKDDLNDLSKDDVDYIKGFATKRMEDLGWVPPKKKTGTNND